MLFPERWLRSQVDVDHLSTEQLVDLLTFAGLEVEGVERREAGFSDVYVAELRAVVQHPGADKLSLCTVFDGEGERQVVCGAKNMKAGDKVALCKPGAVLPGDFKIKKGKIRGEVSMGMLASLDELGLTDERQPGIWILPAEAPTGQLVADWKGLAENVIEVNVTANRPDALSMVGMGRELAALTGRTVRDQALRAAVCTTSQDAGPAAGTAGSGAHAVDIRIEDAAGCSRYIGQVIGGVRIGPSPQWLVERLQDAGVRAINNVVDATNYVMLERGQPLHAFDLRFVRGREIIVRRAGEGERFTTLDGQERTLDPRDLTIRDAEGAVALAGVMGGENSEVRDDTVDLVLEAAHFDPISVRGTAGRLGMHTESSHRFERGVDPVAVAEAAERLAELVLELAGGERVGPVCDLWPRPYQQRDLSIRPARVGALLGLPVPAERTLAILQGLGLRLLSSPDEALASERLTFAIPSHRHDLEQEADLIEEVARVVGYAEVPSVQPRLAARPRRRRGSEGNAPWEARHALVAAGFLETITWDFIDASQLGRLDLPEGHPWLSPMTLLNPLSEELGALRPTLLISLLNAAALNNANREFDLRLFEVKQVYLPKADSPDAHEPQTVGMLWMGRRDPAGWGFADEPADFFDLKGVVEALLRRVGAAGVQWTAGSRPFLDPEQTAELRRGRDVVGYVGRLSPAVAQRFELTGVPFVAEIDLSIFRAPRPVRFASYSRFPAMERDIALLVGASVEAGGILKRLQSSKEKLLESAELFDVYQGEGLADGQRSLAFRLVFRSAERTLKEKEVSKALTRLLSKVLRPGEVELRT